MTKNLKDRVKAVLEITLSNYIIGCLDAKDVSGFIKKLELPKPFVQTTGDTISLVTSIGTTKDGEILGGVVDEAGRVDFVSLSIEFLLFSVVVLECDDLGVFEFLENLASTDNWK